MKNKIKISKKYVLVIIFIILLILLDLLTKSLVTKYVNYGSKTIIANVLNFTYLENDSGAFGIRAK